MNGPDSGYPTGSPDFWGCASPGPGEAEGPWALLSERVRDRLWGITPQASDKNWNSEGTGQSGDTKTEIHCLCLLLEGRIAVLPSPARNGPTGQGRTRVRGEPLPAVRRPERTHGIQEGLPRQRSNKGASSKGEPRNTPRSLASLVTTGQPPTRTKQLFPRGTTSQPGAN